MGATSSPHPTITPSNLGCQDCAAVSDPLKGHTDSVTSVAYSPDGRHIISGSDDHTIRIWNAKTGTAVGALKGHTRPVSSVAYSTDGRHIISGSDDHTIRIWDAKAGIAVGDPLKGHTRSVKSVASSPDGRYIISGSYDHTIRIWDAILVPQSAVLSRGIRAR